MRGYKKIISSFFVMFLLSSLGVRSEIAPNLLEISEGLIVVGDFYENGNHGTMVYSVYKLWHDTFYDEDVIELRKETHFTTPLDSTLNLSSYTIASIILQENRTVKMPIQKYSVNSGDDTIIVYIDISDSLNSTVENLNVKLNGVNYLFSEIDPESPLYSEIEIWVILWLLGYIFELSIAPYTKAAISPQATVGHYIDYGQYQGEVIGFTKYFINEKEYYEAIEVHHDEVIININFFGTIIPHTIGETTLLYERTSGIILNSLEYNSTSDEYYYFNSTEVAGIKPLRTSFPIIALLSPLLIVIPILMVRKKKA